MRKYKTREELAQEQQIRLGLVPVILPIDKLLLVYGRQSTKEQVVKNKESAAQQAVDLVAYGEQLGWSAEKIQLFIENVLMKVGKIVNVSGSLRIDQRAGLQAIASLIESGTVGAVLVRSEDRLFRDETHVQDATFAEMCKRNHVLIITLKTLYDFNNPARDDYDRFLDAARESADYIKKHIKGVMLENRDRKAGRGEFAGHVVPTGLMLNDDRSNYVPNPYWAPVIKRLFKRYRQLDADHAALRREIAGKPIFPELPDKIKERVGYIALTKVEGGYTIKSRSGLEYILTNPVYIGHMAYDGRIVKRNAHPAIVDEDDFNYAFEHLSHYTLDGEPIEHPKRAVRYQQKNNPKRKALLDGVRPNNGEPVITCPGKHVHVYRPSANEQNTGYVIRDYKAMRPEDLYVASIQVKDLDAIFTERLLMHLKVAHAWKALVAPGTSYTVQPPEAKQWFDAMIAEQNAMVEHFQALQQEIQTELVSVDKSIANTMRRIASLKRDLDENPNMAQEDRNDVYAALANLRAQLADLQKKKSRENELAADIRVAKDLMLEVEQGWEKMEFEKQQRFVRIATKQIALEPIADGWLKLTVLWSPVLNLQHYDIAYIRQSGGALWTDFEKALSKEHYSTAKCSWLLAQLPRRSWKAFKSQAFRLGLHRPLQPNDSGLPDWMSLEDQRVMQEYGLEPGEPEQYVWWREMMLLEDANLNGAEKSH